MRASIESFYLIDFIMYLFVKYTIGPVILAVIRSLPGQLEFYTQLISEFISRIDVEDLGWLKAIVCRRIPFVYLNA